MAEDRVAREKEIGRVEKLMRMAFPRQRETHIYKQRLLPEEARNLSVDLLRLKKESIRQEYEKTLVVDSMAIESGQNSRTNFEKTPIMIAPQQINTGLSTSYARQGKNVPQTGLEKDDELASIMHSASTLKADSTQ